MPVIGKFGKIAISWSVITFAGVFAFVLSKNSVEANRVQSMRIRERMRKANHGEYETSQRKF